MRHFTYYCNDEGTYINSWGKAMFDTDSLTTPRAIVDKMATLLTAGRLNEDSRNIISNKISSSMNAFDLRLAQQLMMSTPEFHTTSYMKFTGEPRVFPPVPPMDPTKPYKAVVFLMLEGGYDSYNMLVPMANCPTKDMYTEYALERGAAAMPYGMLLGIDTGSEPQVCSRFGVHSSLSLLQNLYNDQDLVFLANTGVLFEPVTKEDYDTKTLTQVSSKVENHRKTLVNLFVSMSLSISSLCN